jgi:hypothetical protein
MSLFGINHVSLHGLWTAGSVYYWHMGQRGWSVNTEEL